MAGADGGPGHPVPARNGAFRWLALAVALIANLALLAAFHDRYWYPPDDGHYAHVAERLLAGEVLHRDVQEVHGGTINFVNAAALAAFGRRLVSLRYPLAAAGLASALLVFVLVARRSPVLATVTAVAATSLGVLQYLDPGPHWYCLALLFAAVWVLERVPEGAAGWGRWRIEVLGFLAGTTALFHQATGVFVGMAIVTCLLLETDDEPPPAGRERAAARVVLAALGAALGLYLVRATDFTGFALFGVWPLLVLLLTAVRVRRRDRTVASIAGRLAVGGVVAALPLVVYQAAHGALGAWFEDVVVTAPSLLDLPFLQRADYGRDFIAGGFATALLAAGPTGLVNGLYWTVLPLLAGVLGAAVVLGLRRASPSRPGALAMAAVFYGLVALRFQNMTYLAYTLPATLAGLAALASRGPRRLRLSTATGAAALTVVALVFHAGQSHRRSFDEVLSGVRVPAVPSPEIPRSGLRIDPRDVADYTAALALIEREVPPGEPIFALPNSPELYFLSARPNPFRFVNFALGVQSEAAARALLDEIARRPPRLVFYAGHGRYNTPLSRWTIVQLVRSLGFEHLATVGPWDVFRPGSQPGGAEEALNSDEGRSGPAAGGHERFTRRRSGRGGRG